MSSKMCVHVCIYKHVHLGHCSNNNNNTWNEYLYSHMQLWMWAFLTVRGYKCQASAAWRRQQFTHRGRVLMYCQRSNNSPAHINSTFIKQASESAKLLSSSETLERSEEGFTANPSVTALPLTAHRPARSFLVKPDSGCCAFKIFL